MSKNFFRKDQQNIPPSFCEGKQNKSIVGKIQSIQKKKKQLNTIE